MGASRSDQKEKTKTKVKMDTQGLMPGSEAALNLAAKGVHDPTTTPCFDQSWGCAFSSINPFFFAYLGIAAALGLSVLGAAWGEIFGCFWF